MFTNRLRGTVAFATSIVAILAAASGVTAADAQKEDHAIRLAAGKLELQAPDAWVRKKPANNIIEEEFAVTASKGDERDGRVTVMGAGGDIKDNIKRWLGQFSQPGGGETKNNAKKEQLDVAGAKVYLVDLSGTYKDSLGGPMAPSVDRENYRMLAAIVDTDKLGKYFIKFYGPKQTVTDHEAAFMKMIEGMTKKD